MGVCMYAWNWKEHNKRVQVVYTTFYLKEQLQLLLPAGEIVFNIRKFIQTWNKKNKERMKAKTYFVNLLKMPHDIDRIQVGPVLSSSNLLPWRVPLLQRSKKNRIPFVQVHLWNMNSIEYIKWWRRFSINASTAHFSSFLFGWNIKLNEHKIT